MSAAQQLRERPIPFSAEMIRAILEGRKVQTRRVIKHPRNPLPPGSLLGFGSWTSDPGYATLCGPDYPDCDDDRVRCPYGQTGDRLWVRERHAILDMRPECLEYPGARKPRKACPVSVTYHADDVSIELSCPRDQWRESFDNDHLVWRPARFMPRWASRITLELTGVRVERVQDISEADAVAEGCSGAHYEDAARDQAPSDQFHALWDLINAARGYGWDVNPWVWVLVFRKLAP